MNRSIIFKTAALLKLTFTDKSSFQFIERSLRAVPGASAVLTLVSIFIFSGQSLAQHSLLDTTFDGDGKTDIAVYRDGDWYLLQSTLGYQLKIFGTAADRPIQNAFIP